MATPKGQQVFGAGRFYGSPNVTAPTPSPFYVAQDMSVDFKRDIKKLYGQNQLPVDIAAGMLTVTGKVTMGGLAARGFNDMMIGGTLSTGQKPYVTNETLTITTGQTSAAVANAAGFALDLGIFGTTTGVPLSRVSTASVGSQTTGTYALTTAGTYYFSSLDSLTGLKVTYLYSTTGGQTVDMTNQPMGKTGNFTAVVDLLWGTDKGSIALNNCIASDFGIATKLDDFTKPAFGFEAAADANETLGTFSFAVLT